MPGLNMSQYPIDVPSKFDMAVFVTETDKGVSGTWLYSRDLFDATHHRADGGNCFNLCWRRRRRSQHCG